VVAEREFVQVARKVLLTAVLIGAVDAALEGAGKTFDAVGLRQLVVGDCQRCRESGLRVLRLLQRSRGSWRADWRRVA
jgi:hypothetical protein